MKLLIEVTPLMKIQILHVLTNLLLIKIPTEVFTTGLKGLSEDFQTEVKFKNALAQVLYQHAVRIRSNKWESSYESKSGGFYDVMVHMTRTIALCLKQKQIRTKENFNKELSDAFSKIHTYSEEERDVLFHIMGAHHQCFVHKDRCLNVSEQSVRRFDRAQPYSKLEMSYMESYILCPEKNDAHLQLVLDKHAISAIIDNLQKVDPLAPEAEEPTSSGPEKSEEKEE